MSKQITTPEEFAEMMHSIADTREKDEEWMHIEMDTVMMNLLIELGYEEGVMIFNKTPKWYA